MLEPAAVPDQGVERRQQANPAQRLAWLRVALRGWPEIGLALGLAPLQRTGAEEGGNDRRQGAEARVVPDHEGQGTAQAGGGHGGKEAGDQQDQAARPLRRVGPGRRVRRQG